MKTKLSSHFSFFLLSFLQVNAVPSRVKLGARELLFSLVHLSLQRDNDFQPEGSRLSW
jgi:hypothetical protein